MAHLPPDVDQVSAALWDMPANLQGRDCAKSPDLPPTKLDQPLAPPSGAGPAGLQRASCQWLCRDVYVATRGKQGRRNDSPSGSGLLFRLTLRGHCRAQRPGPRRLCT